MATTYSATVLDDAMAHGAARSEVQTLTITGTPTGGTFTMTYSGQTTAGIAYNADAATVDAALEALSNIAADEVACTGGPLPGTPVVVTFLATSGNVALMTASGASLTGGTTPAATVALTTGGYGAQKATLNAAIDVLGAAIDTFVTDTGCTEPEAAKMLKCLYDLGSYAADCIRDQTS